MTRRLLTHEGTKLHIGRLASDGDAACYRAVKDVQSDIGITEVAKSVAVICHEIKNVSKLFLELKNTLPKACNLTKGRMKAIGCDIRRVMAALAAESEGKEGTELSDLLTRYRHFHFPQVVNHHCGMCEDCDPRWCSLKCLFDANTEKEHPIDKHMLMSQYLNEKKTRFNCFLAIAESTKKMIKEALIARYTETKLLKLIPMLHNNHVENLWTRVIKFNQGKRLNTTQRGIGLANMMMAILENNDGYSWLDILDERLGLKKLAHKSRVQREIRLKADRERQKKEPYLLQRKRSKQNKDALLKEGKKSPTHYGASQKSQNRNSNEHSVAQNKKKRKRKVNCAYCHKSHKTRNCCFFVDTELRNRLKANAITKFQIELLHQSRPI